MSDLFMEKGAVVSNCGKFRCTLCRIWDCTLPPLVWIMLNPSVADADIDDPTIKKCMGFARRMGFGSISVVNLFAYRATDPKDLKKAGFPVGEHNDQAIIDTCAGEMCMAAWGAAAPKKRVEDVFKLIRDVALHVECLGVTDKGHPKHPLYVSYDTVPETYRHSQVKP